MKQLAKFAFFLFLVEQIKSMKTQDECTTNAIIATNSSLLVSKQLMTNANEARQPCSSIGGYLWEPKSDFEIDEVLSKLRTYLADNTSDLSVFLGFTSYEGKRLWFTHDGSVVSDPTYPTPEQTLCEQLSLEQPRSQAPAYMRKTNCDTDQAYFACQHDFIISMEQVNCNSSSLRLRWNAFIPPEIGKNTTMSVIATVASNSSMTVASALGKTDLVLALQVGIPYVITVVASVTGCIDFKIKKILRTVLLDNIPVPGPVMQAVSYDVKTADNRDLCVVEWVHDGFESHISHYELTFGKENSVMVVNPTGALTFAPNAGNVRTEYDLSKFEVTGLNMVRFKIQAVSCSGKSNPTNVFGFCSVPKPSQLSSIIGIVATVLVVLVAVTIWAIVARMIYKRIRNSRESTTSEKSTNVWNGPDKGNNFVSMIPPDVAITSPDGEYPRLSRDFDKKSSKSSLASTMFGNLPKRDSLEPSSPKYDTRKRCTKSGFRTSAMSIKSSLDSSVPTTGSKPDEIHFADDDDTDDVSPIRAKRRTRGERRSKKVKIYESASYPNIFQAFLDTLNIVVNTTLSEKNENEAEEHETKRKHRKSGKTSRKKGFQSKSGWDLPASEDEENKGTKEEAMIKEEEGEKSEEKVEEKVEKDTITVEKTESEGNYSADYKFYSAVPV